MPNENNEVVGFLVINTGGRAGFEEVARIAFATLIAPDVHTSAAYDVGGSLEYADLFVWLWTFGVSGIVLLVAATTFSSIDVFLAQARGLGILGGMHAGRVLYYKIAGWNIAVPLAAAGIGGGAVAALLGFLMTRLRVSGSVSWSFISLSVLGIVVIAVALALLCGEAATRLVRQWRPTAD